MKVKDMMTSDVEVVRPDTTLVEVAAKMKQRDIGFLPVMDQQRILGTITDRDVVLRSTAFGKEPKTHRASDIMSKEVVFIYDDSDVLEAARLMEVKKIRRLMVLDHEKSLVGVVSLGDLSAQTGSHELTGEVMEHITGELQAS